MSTDVSSNAAGDPAPGAAPAIPAPAAPAATDRANRAGEDVPGVRDHHRHAAGGHVRRDPQRDHHERRAAAADGGPEHRCAHRAVALHRLHAHHGRRDSHHRVHPAAADHPGRVHAGHGALLWRHAAGRPRAGLRSPAAGPHRPGRRHRHHAAAADDHHPHARAAGAPRRRHGQRQHRHFGCAGTGPHGFRPDPPAFFLAVHVRVRAADRPRRAGHRGQVSDQHRRNRENPARRPLRGAHGPRLRRPGVRPEPDRRRPGRLPHPRRGGAGRRRGGPGGFRPAPAEAAEDRRPPAGPARLHASGCSPCPCCCWSWP